MEVYDGWIGWNDVSCAMETRCLCERVPPERAEDLSPLLDERHEYAAADECDSWWWDWDWESSESDSKS